MIITTICITIILIYLVLIGLLCLGFDKVEDFRLRDLEPKTKFSIVIPFRNEAENLPELLNSILNLNYPKQLFEIIMVDDDPNDDSTDIIEPFAKTDLITIIENKRTSNSPKKDAITSAINLAKHEWIITTDADCILPKYWLDTFDEFIQSCEPNCIVAPVRYSKNGSFFNQFQALDFFSLQGATIGGFGLKKPFLCNGANLAYRKKSFENVNGYDGNNTIASGDDVFLLEKLLKLDSNKVYYLKSDKVIVTTKPVAKLSSLIQQRLRWASKTSQSKNWFTKLVGSIVLTANLVIIALVPLTIFKLLSLKIALALFVIKFSIDFLLLFKTTRFFKQEHLLVPFIPSSFIYPFFSVYIVLLSVFKSYNWKGRTFKT